MYGFRGATSPLGLVNSTVVVGQRPTFSVMVGGMPCSDLRSRPGFHPECKGRFEAAGPRSELGDLGVNVPVPMSHAGLLANATAARLMWTRQPILLRWHSPDGRGPYVWRIYAAPHARPHVLYVLKQVLEDKGGARDVTITQRTIENDPDGDWCVMFWPASRLPTAETPEGAAPSEQLGSAATVGWAPRRWPAFGPREWSSLAGGDDEAPPLPGKAPGGAPPAPAGVLGQRLVQEAHRVGEIIVLFRAEGEKAAMQKARAYGRVYLEGAAAWVRHRASTEEHLAREVASLTASLARHRAQHVQACASCVRMRVMRAFLDERLAEVRASKKNGATPAQAVADRPELPLVTVPRWLPYAALLLGAIGLARSG